MTTLANLLKIDTPEIAPMRAMSLDDLWAEAETLGVLRIYTRSDFYDRTKKGYDVKIIGWRKNTKMEVERTHTSLHCALADAINEARDMGLGEPG